MVGIGASAGGLAALERFFSNVKPGSGMAYVVMTHQAPDRATLLPALIARHANIEVMDVSDRTRLHPDRIYVAPPGCCLELHDEHLHALPAPGGVPVLSVDHLFRSLAHNEGDRAIGIVLSGNGSDGTLGIAAIKAAAGMVMAQELQSAQYTGMPASAINTQLVDYVLPPEDMPEQLVRYVRGLDALRAQGELDENDGALHKVLLILRNRTGNDFRAYKKSTINRRVERRMHVHGISEPEQYARFLETTPYEVDALFKELLISVTSFFRDPLAFAALEHELASLIERKHDDTPLRAWICGCATGEEAYSIAIVIKEVLQRTGKDLKVQIFATDIDQQAVDVARAGRYPEGIAADVSPERLALFFTREESGYCVNKDIRELIVFAVQNVIKDPPFTKLDLLSCRNVLIYLEGELQRRVLSLFGYSLRPGGLLLLGTSESIAGFDDRFAMVDKRWKLFRRREGAVSARLPDFPADMPLPFAHGIRTAPIAGPATRGTGGGMSTIAERILLSSFVPPSVVISERGELIYVHGRIGEFFEPAAGEPSHNAFNMAREGLRLELPATVRQAAISSTPVVRRGLQVKTNGGFSAVTVTARKLTEPDVVRGAFLVTFDLEHEAEPAPEKESKKGKRFDQITALEEELQRTRENLQGTIEELETMNEELKSTNEELQSTNEELQSANEELETSREEMQSLNEELQTVNAELEERNRALSQANDDMQNLLNNTDIATVFLDDKLAIKRFTRQAKKVFSLIDTDIGRPISDLSANLRYDALVDDAREVLRTLVFSEREIQTKEGAWRLMRIMPYRTHENLIDGLVITFVDIDRLKRAQQAALDARTYAEEVIDSLNQALVVIDEHMLIVSASRAFYGLFDSDPKYVIGTPIDRVFDGSGELQQLFARVDAIREKDDPFEPTTVQTKIPRSGDIRRVVFSAHRIKRHGGAPHVLLTIEPAP